MRRVLTCLIVLTLLHAGQSAAGKLPPVLPAGADSMMFRYLRAIVDRQFAARDSLLSGLETAAGWRTRAATIRDSIVSWTGELPERTPLEARVTGRIEAEGYTVEKIIFCSRPGFPVSASLYLPRGREWPAPAILNVIGHSPAGKAAVDVQQRCIAQARKGFVALAVDCAGQGERRRHVYDSYGRAPGNLHRALGIRAFLAGWHVFNIMVWDAIRAVDYLCSRPEVDTMRIGCTGTSGGGMMTTYLLPFEPRIRVAVPACNPNTWSHRVRARLATDHEQVFYGAFAAGIDPRGDPLFCLAPDPLLVNATTDDNLNPPRGVWELDNWLQRAWAAFGSPEKVRTSMVRAPHDYNREQREAAYAWFLRWLGGDGGDFLEGEIEVREPEELWSAPGGDVYSMEGSRTPRDLLMEYVEHHRSEPAAVRGAEDAENLRRGIADDVREILRMEGLPGVPRVEPAGDPLAVDGLEAEPVVLAPEPGISLPAYWLRKAEAPADAPVVVCVLDQGKSSLLEKENRRIVRSLTGKGFRLFAVDLRGYGETAPGMEGYFWDFLAGQPLAGQRTGDFLSVLEWLKANGVEPSKTRVWARGVNSLWAVLSLVLAENPPAVLVLEQAPLSFGSIVRADIPGWNHEVLLPGVLERFDLPQIYQSLAPRRVSLVGPRAGDGSPANSQQIAEEYAPVQRTYRSAGAPDAWAAVSVHEGRGRTEAVLGALGVSGQ